MTNCVMFKKDYLHDVCRKEFVLKLNALVKELDKNNQLWALNPDNVRYGYDLNIEFDWFFGLVGSDINDITRSLINELTALNDKVNNTLDISSMYDVVDADGNTLFINICGYPSSSDYVETYTLSDGRKIEIYYHEDGVPGNVHLVV